MLDMHPNITKKFKELLKKTLKNPCIEYRTFDFKLPSIINCHRRQSN